jgi:hypothetical protein
MDWLKTLLIAAGGAVVIIAIWFGRLPAMCRARKDNGGSPTVGWWVSLCIAIVLIAFLANRLPDSL